ncbi:MAG: KpsF/GutQ family sugar-phosphate isomerase [Flavobacteriales bacterium]|nr:KpsF/GutQ family sugar-phosphate isomerase [Flavobacteriales bacterium]
MKDHQTITESARKTLQLEAQAINQLVDYIDDQFVQVVQLILQSDGRVVITGIGKSANIANKIVATLNSTGTPAVFMHAADAIHGDLGNVQKHDIVICISKSGESPEIKVLIPLLKNMGNTLVGMVGNLGSFLAERSDWILNTTVSAEACPNNLAPTSSTTAQLAMGDALAVALMECRGFKASDFARYHPGGALGKRLYTHMSDLISPDRQPKVQVNTPIPDVIVEISSNRLGATVVMENNRIVGIITDGDLRRMLEKGLDMSTLLAKDIMSVTPKTVESDALAVDGFHLMESNSISQIVVIDQGEYAGIVHLHDILKEGIY